MYPELTLSNFENTISDSSLKTILVFISASWCSNCKRQTMQIEKFNEQEDSTCVLYSINADESMELVKSLRVMAVPTILIYRHGILIKKLTGVKSAKSLSNTIAQVNTFDESQSKENEFKSLWSRLFGK